MNKPRWGVTFLLSDSRLSYEDKLQLIAKASLMHLDGEERCAVTGDNYDGVIYTKHEWKVVGGASGVQFEADLDSALDQHRIRLRFLVDERTLRDGARVAKYSMN